VKAVFEAARRARLQALVMHQLSNGAAVWDAHRTQTAVPPLRFRNGLVLLHGEGDAPLFLLFEIFANACYRRQLDELAADSTIIDIGANIGAFTLDCAVRFPSARIDAYEPNPRAYRMLQANIAANGLESRVRAFPEAVGRSCGALELWSDGATITASAYPRPSDTRGLAETCSTVDLPAVLARADGRTALVKLDAEGAEADILEGGRAVLRGIAQCIGEYHEDRVPDVVARCRSVFEECGFAFTLASSRRCGPLFRARRLD
jgi:FkbM family methyltransferase